MVKTEKSLWFKRRRYGYGWTPVRWQGWFFVILFLGLIAAATVVFIMTPYSNESLWIYLDIVISFIILLIIIAFFTGPTPRWRWGKKPGDNSKEDV